MVSSREKAEELKEKVRIKQQKLKYKKLLSENIIKINVNFKKIL